MSKPATEQSDAELMLRVQQGQTSLFAYLVCRYEVALLRVAASRLGRRDWAEDVVQETFLAAYKSRSTYDAARSFRTWLFTILFNQCSRYFRARKREPEHEAWEIDGGPVERHPQPATGDDATPPKQLLAKERTELLDAALRRLPPQQSDALRLRFFGGLKFREIAETVQCSLPTAKARVKAGLLRMAEMLPRAGISLADVKEDSCGAAETGARLREKR